MRLLWVVVIVVGVVVGGVVGKDRVGLKGGTLSSATQSFDDLPFESLYAELELEDNLEISYDLFCSSQNYKNLPTYNPTPTCLPCNYTGGATREGTCADPNLNVVLPGLEGLGLPNCDCNPTFCSGEVLKAGEPPRRYTIRERDLRLVFRYEHTDYEQGFAVQLTPIDEGPVNFLVANAMTLDPDHTLAYSYSTAALEYLKVCPSFNRFGPGSESITYFIFVLPGDLVGNKMASFDLSVTLIPSLTEEEEEPYQQLEFWNGTSLSPNNTLSNAPFYLPGDYFSNYYNGSTPGYYVLNILVPLEKCLTYSISFELTYLDTSTFDYFSLVDVKVERASWPDLVFNTLPRARPFRLEKVVELAYNESNQISFSSEGRIYSACKTEGPETLEYVNIRISPGPRFQGWGLLIFFRETSPDSRTRVNRKLSELTPLAFQRVLRPSIAMKCPCQDPCDSCPTRAAASLRFFNRLSGLTPETFPALIAKSQPDCDLAAEIGIPIRSDFLYRCHSYWRDTSCGVMRMIPVLEKANPRIYPMPLVVRLLDPFSFSVAPDFFANLSETNRIQNNALGVFFTVSANEIGYLSKNRLQNHCQLRFAYPTLLHNAHDMPPAGEYFPISSLKNDDKSCTNDDFDTIGDLLGQTESDLNSLTRSGVLVGSKDGASSNKTAEELFESSASATYASYSLLFTEEWQRCEGLANSFLVFEDKNITIANSAECGLVYDATDPCCNPEVAWEECCVAEGHDILVGVSEPLFTNNEQLEAECVQSECVATFVEDYRISYQEVFLEGICKNEFTLSTGLNRVMSECREKWIGSDEFGKLCYSDDNCTQLFDGQGQCDLSTFRCTGVREVMELRFLDCLLTDVDSVTRSAIANEMAKSGDFERGKNVTAAGLRNYLLSGGECVSDYGPMSHLRARFVARSLESPDEQLCPVCYDLYCLSGFGCEWPLQCLDKRQLCGATVVPFTSPFCEEPSEDDLQCDHNATFSEEECEIDTDQCIFCHNSSHCEILPASSEDECVNTPLCLLPGGEILWDVDEDACNEMRSCTEKCLFGSDCPDKDSCESVGGFCEDTDRILESIQLAVEVEPNLSNSTSGVCVTPISAFNAPACPYVTENVIARPGSFDFRTGNSWDFTTHRGCVAFSDCVPASIQFSDGTGGARLPDYCIRKPATIEECESDVYNGSWLPLPIQTKEDCENPLRVSDEDWPGYCLEDRTGASPYLSRKGRSDCEECGGVPRVPSKWREGRWLGGLARRAEWRKPKMVSTYHYVTDSISFLVLNDLLSLSSANVNSFLNDVSVSCGVLPFEDYLSLFSCNCDGEATPDSDCEAPFQSSGGGANIIGGAWMCPGVRSKVGVAAGSIEVDGGESVQGDLCKFTEIALAPDEVFVGNHKRVPLTVLGDPNPVDAEPVRNDNGASVGDVVGDGIQLLYEETGFVDFETEVEQIIVSLFIDIEELSKFPHSYVFDFGLEVLDDDDKRFPGEMELRPMDVTMVPGGRIAKDTTVGDLLASVDDEVVVEMSGYWNSPFGNGSPRLYPITRQEFYKSEEENDVLSDGETAMIAVFAALYGLAMVIGVILLLVLLTKAPSLTNLVLSFFVILAFLFRCIYLALYASGDLRNEDASSFVLVEPPSFFILSVASVLTTSFGFCLYCLKNNIPQEKAFVRFWLYWGVFNVFLYLILMVVLVLMTQLDTEDDVTITCYGRRAEVEESFTIQAIRIGYHSFLLLIAVITAIVLFFLGHSLEKTLESQSLSTLSTVAGVSVLLSNILWVIYSGLSGSSPYFVIPLFFVEVPPLLLLMVLVVPKSE